jgi:hypothetical protein
MPINPTWSLHSQKYIALGHKHLTWVIRSRVELFELPNVTFLMELKEKKLGFTFILGDAHQSHMEFATEKYIALGHKHHT